jgi:signal peptidase
VALNYRKEAVTIIAGLVVIIIIFSSLYLYTDNWPPAVIVESRSMQHGNNFVFGVINTGDIVGVKKIKSFQEVQTYLVARERGDPFNYGEYGNVIVYDNYLLNELVIHRAIFYVDGWEGDTPLLYGDTNPSWLAIVGYDVFINDIGYTHKNLVVNLQNYIGQTGFVTMGDYNFAVSGYDIGNYTVAADQNVGIDNSLVNVTQVVGYAVGYLPVVGVLKLWATGKVSYIPELSNVIMVVIIILIIALILVPIPSGKNRKDTEKK